MDRKLVRRVAMFGALSLSLAIVVERRLLPLALRIERSANGPSGAIPAGVAPRFATWDAAQPIEGDADSPEEEARPAISADGRWLAFAGPGAGADRDLYLARFDGSRASGARRLRELATEADETAPCFDGERLFFASNRSGGAGGFDLYVADFDGEEFGDAEPVARVNSESDEVDPWIDGDRLYFASRRSGAAARDFDLYLADLGSDAPAARIEAATSPRDEREPCVAANGGALYFASDRGGQFDIFRCVRDGGAWTELARVAELSTEADERAPSAPSDGLTLGFERAAGGADAEREFWTARTRELFRVPVRREGWYDLALAAALAIAALLAWLAGRWNELDVIWKCWLLSILLHALALWAMRYWRPEAEIGEMRRRGSETFRVRVERALEQGERERGGSLSLAAPPAASVAPPLQAELEPLALASSRVEPAPAAPIELASGAASDPPPVAPSTIADASGRALPLDVAVAAPHERYERIETAPRAAEALEARPLGRPAVVAGEAAISRRTLADLPAAGRLPETAPVRAAPLTLPAPIVERADDASAVPARASLSENARAAPAAAPSLASPVENAPARIEAEHPGDALSIEAKPIAGRRAREDAAPQRLEIPAPAAAGDDVAPPAPEPPAPRPLPVATADREPSRELPRLDSTPYRARFGSSKEVALRERGGSAETERAVSTGLAYLASRQRDGGEWGERERYHAKYRRTCVGTSGLALLAFLGAGHTQASGTEHSGVVARALDFLLSTQDHATGHFGDTDAYGHGIATYALAECLAITRDERLRAPIERAVREILANQLGGNDPRIRGGWSYFYPDRALFDRWPRASITAWQVMALESAKLGGIDVPEAHTRAAREFLLAAWDDRRGAFRYSHDPERLGSAYPVLPGSTPAALFALSLLGEDVRSPEFEDAVRFVVARAPARYRSWSEDAFVHLAEGNLYFWYYGSLVLLRVGGSAWERWNEALKATLLPAQQRDGSWRPLDVYCGYAGDTDEDRIYATAACTLSLEVYYRYLTPLLEVR
jgi:Tol biopolymer transport system component